MLTIDPLFPLAVQLAEGHGQYAFFLGSGVSRPAGVPSGWDVRQQTLRDLFRLQEDAEEVDESAFAEWLAREGLADASYSSIIGALRPDKPQQREYLAGFFESKDPTLAHRTLARLVKQRMVRVIITTNFDPLMERALDEQGASYSVIASDAELKDAEPREHASCRIIKPHGDWQDLNLRNSDEEVAELPPLLEAELREIFNRYGLAVMGYGAYEKERLVTLLKERSSPYGLYWLVRGEPEKTAKEIVQRQGGRWIQRESADTFMAELERKIELFLSRPDSQTPEVAADEFALLLRRNDQIGAEQFIDRLTQRIFEVGDKAETDLRQRAQQVGKLTYEELVTLGTDVLLRSAEPLLVVGTVAIQHRIEAAFDYILDWSLRPLFERSLISYRDDIKSMYAAVAGVLFIGWGIFCLQRRQFALLRRLFQLTIHGDRRVGRMDEFSQLYYAKAAVMTGRELVPVYSFAQDRLSKTEWFVRQFAATERERYPLFGEIAQFDCLHSLWLSAQAPSGEPLPGYTRKVPFFGCLDASRLDPLIKAIERDDGFCRALAEDLFGEGIEEFRRELPQRYARFVTEAPRPPGIFDWDSYTAWPTG